MSPGPGKKKVWCPHVRNGGLSEANVAYCIEESICVIVVTFWQPHSDLAPP